MELTTNNAKETYRLGYKIGSNIKKLKKGTNAFIIGLVGELGSGKTTFTQGFAKGLRIQNTVPSPTFTIVRQYTLLSQPFDTFLHIDLYRLDGNSDDIDNLGLNDFFSDSSNLVIIEWADTMNKQLETIFSLRFEIRDETTRKIIIASKNSNILKTVTGT